MYLVVLVVIEGLLPFAFLLQFPAVVPQKEELNLAAPTTYVAEADKEGLYWW